jgi:SAM-dependent methyltransferase
LKYFTKSTTKKYFSQFKISSPSYSVAHISGKCIEKKASKYFREKLLDIGCGSKSKQSLIGNHVQTYLGIDQPSCIHDRSKIDLFGDAAALPVKDSVFDSILCTAVLEHLENPSEAIFEACRVLKDGGYAIYTAPLFWHLHEEPRDFFRYTRHGLMHLFEASGFEVIEIISLSGFWTTFITEFNYYLQRFKNIFLKFLIHIWVTISNLFLPFLDNGLLRDERFTWLYLVVVRKS